jgi:D-alanyl-lipoteichoic acid acyltransferase DltB (MBOAT superfamily)
VSGLWHGANYTFIIWGGLHGLLLVFEKRFKLKQSLLYSIAVFALVMLLWLPFRAESFGHFRDMTYALVDISSYSLIGIKEAVHAFSLQKFGLLIVVGIVFLTIELSMKKLDFNQWIAGKKSWQKVTVYYILAIAILLLINLDIQPDYIYFQF